jgi:hypothetical protein
MAPTKQQKAFCAVEYAKTTSVITVQRKFRRQFDVDPPDKNYIKRWHMPTLNGVLVMFGGRHLENFVPTGTAGISIKTRSI